MTKTLAAALAHLWPPIYAALGLMAALALLGCDPVRFRGTGPRRLPLRPSQLQTVTCVQDDISTHRSDLYVETVPGSDQDHLNAGLLVCQRTDALALAQRTGLTPN